MALRADVRQGIDDGFKTGIGIGCEGGGRAVFPDWDWGEGCATSLYLGMGGVATRGERSMDEKPRAAVLRSVLVVSTTGGMHVVNGRVRRFSARMAAAGSTRQVGRRQVDRWALKIELYMVGAKHHDTDARRSMA